MDMCVIVQGGKELDARKVIEFIERKRKAKLAVVHSSLKDEVATLDFFEHLVRNLKVPFVGTNVSGTVTPKEGYCEDAVAVAVLCGDFDVKVFHEKIGYEEPEKTVNKIIPQLEGWNLCLVYSANYYKKNVFLESILRGIQNAQPDLQIGGNCSSPPPSVATPEGIFKDHIACAALRGIDFDFAIDSGFKFDETSDDKFIITRSDEHYIYEINNKNAVEEYSKIQHMRPYFINMLHDLTSRPDVVELYKILSEMNKVLYEGILKTFTTPLGTDLNGKAAEILLALELNEKRRHILAQSRKSTGTVLKHIVTSPEDQLAVYDRIHEKTPNAKAMLVSSCAMRTFWFNFDFKAVEEKLKRFNCPFLLSYVFGELGAYTPYKDPNQNVVHGGVVKALIFR